MCSPVIKARRSDPYEEGVRLVSAVESQLRGPFLRAARALAEHLDGWDVDSRTFNVIDALDEIPWLELFEEPMAAAWVQSVGPFVVRSSRIALEDLGIDVVRRKSRVFEDELAVSYLDQQGLEFAKSMSKTSKRAALETLDDALVNNLGVRETVSTLRGQIGLTPQQAETLRNRTARARARGLSGTKLKRFVDRERTRMLRQRAENIARTELVAARNAGTTHAWRIAQSQGLIDKNMRRVWIPGKACPICIAIAAAGPVPINRPFRLPGGRTVDGPPAHPQCRCSQGLVRVGKARGTVYVIVAKTVDERRLLAA